MALLAVPPAAVAPAAATSSDRTAAAESTAASAGTPLAHCCRPSSAVKAVDAWVVEACRVRLDGEGNVLTDIPALLAAAVGRLVAASAAADAATAAAGRVRQFEPTRLHGCRPPGIGVEAYAERLLRYCKCSPVAFVAAFAYMARLHAGAGAGAGGRLCEALRVDSLTAHRMMAVGVVVATKFFDDKYYSNDHYAQVAGVTLQEFNAMELDFLFRLDFRARVAAPELAATLREMHALAGAHAAHSALLTQPLHAAAAAAAPAAGSGCCGVAALAAAVSLAPPSCPASASEGGDSCSDATTAAAALCPCPAGEEEQAAASAVPPVAPAAAAALLPWAHAAGGEAAGAATAAADGAQDCGAATPRHSKRRCSMEAQVQQLLCGPHSAHAQLAEERQRLAEPICQAA